MPNPQCCPVCSIASFGGQGNLCIHSCHQPTEGREIIAAETATNSFKYHEHYAAHSNVIYQGIKKALQKQKEIYETLSEKHAKENYDLGKQHAKETLAEKIAGTKFPESEVSGDAEDTFNQAIDSILTLLKDHGTA